MGASNTKAEVVKPVEVEQSSGFHVLELHLPTAGFGLVTLFFAFAFFICCLLCFRHLSRRWMRRPHSYSQGNHPFVQWSPHSHGRPQVFYLGDPYHQHLSSMPLQSRIQEVNEETVQGQSSQREPPPEAARRSHNRSSSWINEI